MALTKVTKSGITNNAIDADKLEDGTILAADITPGTITADKLNSTLDLSSKTVTLPNTSVTNAQLAGSIANAKLANSSLTINGSSVSLGSSISAGALDWQTVIVADGSTGTTGVAGRGYFINTTSAAHTFTLPVSAAIGDTIGIVDYAGTFATNKLTIARNGNNIQGVANNSQLGTNRASVTLVYVDATKGWVYQNESNVADLQGPIFTSATGGTITTSGNFKIHSFTGDGCFVVSTLGNSPTVPTGGPSNVDYLVVAGGGGGSGGGGGAGGFRTSFPSPGCNAGSFPITATTFPIAVGAGGAGGPGFQPRAAGTNGSPSIFSTITSAGGGGGGRYGCAPYDALPGGSGGGGGQSGPTTGAAGSGNSPPTSPSQGNTGGTGGSNGSTYTASGGGGGSGAVGGNANASPGVPAPTNKGGNGGAGTANSITGSPVTYSGGGGGSTDSGANPAGGGNAGPGGGTAGTISSNPATSGTPNTGGGGGGAAGGVSGTGGKGIVVIRYKFQ